MEALITIASVIAYITIGSVAAGLSYRHSREKLTGRLLREYEFTTDPHVILIFFWPLALSVLLAICGPAQLAIRIGERKPLNPRKLSNDRKKALE